MPEVVIAKTTNAELLSYVINQTPALKTNLDLPVQGQSILPIGKIIMGNPEYKNAFINTINLIGLTVIKRNGWENPWKWFTEKGTLRYGQAIREMICDLANVYDYNAATNDEDRFLTSVVPNVLSNIHEVNFQKFYEVSISDSQMAMAFNEENGLYNLIMECVGSLYDAYEYDSYIVNKYMLCRRIVDGTIPASYISGYSGLSNREKVAAMKSVANKMSFKNPNYNPAGIRKGNRLEDLILIMNTDFEGDYSTDVLATSFFRNDAELKTNGVLVDGFGSHDEARLSTLLGDQYTAFTSDEKTALSAIPSVIISKDFFMDYFYAIDMASDKKETEFYNPTKLTRNLFLHVWAVFSTSPFEQCTVFTSTQPSVTSVTVAPSTATVKAGNSLQMTATVVTAGFANKAVSWSVGDANGDAITGVTIDEFGTLKIASTVAASTAVYVTATSVYTHSVQGQATITTA